jgi:hypothetical protein
MTRRTNARIAGSILPAVCFPLQLAGLLGGPVTSFMWYPILLFEMTLALLGRTL